MNESLHFSKIASFTMLFSIKKTDGHSETLKIVYAPGPGVFNINNRNLVPTLPLNSIIVSLVALGSLIQISL